MAPRGTRADHYQAIAGFYGSRLIEDILNPNVPEFVIQRDARLVAHYALTALKLAARPRRQKSQGPAIGAPPIWDSIPA